MLCVLIFFLPLFRQRLSEKVRTGKEMKSKLISPPPTLILYLRRKTKVNCLQVKKMTCLFIVIQMSAGIETSWANRGTTVTTMVQVTVNF